MMSSHEEENGRRLLGVFANGYGIRRKSPGRRHCDTSKVETSLREAALVALKIEFPPQKARPDFWSIGVAKARLAFFFLVCSW